MDFDINDFPKTQNNTYEFQGIPSGDGESFCWDVDKDTFIKIKGELPSKYDESMDDKNLFRIYPTNFYGLFDKSKCNMKISIEVISE